MNAKHRWNNDGKDRSTRRTCHFVHQKSHMQWVKLNPGIRGEGLVINGLSKGTVVCVCVRNEWSTFRPARPS
jgi:ribosomal protein S5